jgi:hypothetical protein
MTDRKGVTVNANVSVEPLITGVVTTRVASPTGHSRVYFDSAKLVWRHAASLAGSAEICRSAYY